MLIESQEEMDFFCELFLKRAHLDYTNTILTDFFREQVRDYLCLKNTQLLSTPEIDMICDLIEDTFDEVQSYIKNTALGALANLKNLLETVQIDFPLVENEPVLLQM